MYYVWPTFLSLRRNILDRYLSLRPEKEIASSARRHNIFVIKLLCKYICCTKTFGFFTVCVYRVLLGKPEGRRPLGRPRRRWVDNIRNDLQEVGCGYMDWTGLAQDKDW